MGKRDMRKVLQEHCAECFLDEQNHDYFFKVYIDDSIVQVRLWGATATKKYGPNTMLNINTIAREMLKRPLFMMKRYGLSVFCMVFDKSSFVTAAKSHEQTKRDISCYNDLIDRFDKREELPVELSAIQWQGVIENRYWRQRFISNLCKQMYTLAEQLLSKDLSISKTSTIVFDYEEYFLVQEKHKLLSESMIRVSLGRGFESESESKAAFDSLRNTFGEFDVAFKHYVTNPYLLSFLHSSNDAILVDSIDTDILCILMLLESEREQMDWPK